MFEIVWEFVRQATTGVTKLAALDTTKSTDLSTLEERGAFLEKRRQTVPAECSSSMPRKSGDAGDVQRDLPDPGRDSKRDERAPTTSSKGSPASCPDDG
ncbi:hypothetical protein ACFQDG_00080 [Natronoarchaeum mannanilyticum]|uniref:hypothetical protein n=1 Tax=Natronoarchaeum mannanilyticum TaxID=926360 RepID=UPI0031D88824